MAGNGTSFEVKGLPRKDMAELTSKAKRLGTTPERYVRDLVQEDLALDRKARTTSLSDLMGPGTEVDEAELDRIVESVRTRHHRQTTRKR